MIRYIFLLVLVLMISPVSQTLATVTNRVTNSYIKYNYDTVEAFGLDKDPPKVNGEKNLDPNNNDTIMEASSYMRIKNYSNPNTHYQSVSSSITCFSENYKGTWGMAFYVSQPTRASDNNMLDDAKKAAKFPNDLRLFGYISGDLDFDGIISRYHWLSGETLGHFDCRDAIANHECRSGASINGDKIHASEIGPDNVWARSEVPVNEAQRPAPTLGLFPSVALYITIDGEEMVDTAPGDTVSVELVMPSDKGYSSITWYLAGPYTDSSAGSQTSMTTSSSSDIETSASHSFTLPSDAPGGVYTFTASISPHSSASDQNVYEYSFKIYVSSPALGLSPSGALYITINGEKMVDTAPGDTVSVELVMPSDKGYSSITWYLAGPYTDSSAGSQTSMTTSSSSDIETSASHSFTLPSDAPGGVYTFTASISPHSSASDQNVYQYSFKIYVS